MAQSAPATYLQVFTTLPGARAAHRLARELVCSRLAACAQVVGPVRSAYRWQGRVEEAREWLCLLKTSRRRFPALARAIRAAHPYEVPEIIALPIAAGSRTYLAWLDDSLRPE
ncbi:MAG: divalent-cation tolerance protein CutA [bacterium]